MPRLSLPGFALFVAGVCLWGGSSSLALSHTWPLLASVPFNALATYMLFTVMHDACHNSLSSVAAVNLWIGRVAGVFFASVASFRTFRYIHMQHHRFTNDPMRDPDEYTGRGPRWQRPLRWASTDLNYLVFYLPRLRERPRAERIELVVSSFAALSLLGAAIATGHVVQLLVLLVVPARLTNLWLAFAFDYLPHHGLNLAAAQDRFKATRNRVGLERVLTPLLLYQNYHLVHHLHPVIPFHKYLAVWRRNEDAYLEHDPALSTPRGRAITAAEYRQMRRLASH